MTAQTGLDFGSHPWVNKWTVPGHDLDFDKQKEQAE